MPSALFHATTFQQNMRGLDEPLLTRPRILKIINSTSHVGTIAWIVGALGAGKSTVALQWARELGTEVQFVSARPVQISEGSQPQPPSEFGLALQNLLNACAIAHGDVNEDVIASHLDRVVELSQHQDQPFILDDLELIRRDAMSVLHKLFVKALPRLKVKRALFVSRTIDSKVMAGLQAHRSLRMVLPSTLELDEQETEAAHKLGVFGRASSAEVAIGWIVGMLTDLYGHGGRTIEPTQFRTDVLNHMVLQQPPLVLRVMIVGAFLPFGTRGVWERWFSHLGIPRWSIPSTLTQLPTRSIPESPDRFEIVPAMSNALRDIRNITVSDDDLNELLIIAMDRHISNHDPESAAMLAIEHGLEYEYWREIKPLALELSRTEDWDEIARLVQTLPIQVIVSDVDLSFWCSFALASATRWSEVIDIQFRVANERSSSESALIRGRNHLQLGFVARAHSNYEEAYSQFEQAYNALPKSAHQERMYAAASADTSASQICLGQESLPWRKHTAYELAHLPPRQRWWHGNMGPIALGYIASSGRLEMAYSQAEQQVAGLKNVGFDLSWRYLLLMAAIDTERMRFDSAAEALEKAQSHIQSPLQHQMHLLAESKLLAARGDYKAANAMLNNPPYSTGRSINNEFIFKLTLARQTFDSGDAAEADFLLGTAAWPEDSWPRNFGDSHPNLIIALIRAETGERDVGLELANKVLQEARCRWNRFLEIRSHAILAHIYHENGDTTARDREIHSSVLLNAEVGYQLVFFIQGRDTRTLADALAVVSGNNTIIGRLSSREIEVLGLVAKSFSNKQIAEAMFISISTVKNHLASVYDKLGTNNRRAALQLARKYGFVDRHDFL